MSVADVGQAHRTFIFVLAQQHLQPVAVVGRRVRLHGAVADYTGALNIHRIRIFSVFVLIACSWGVFLIRNVPTRRAPAEEMMPLDPSTPTPPDVPDPDVVLTHPEAARMLRLSTRSLDRLIETGEAPPRIQLTSRRVGYWRRDVLAWLQARTSPAKHTA